MAEIAVYVAKSRLHLGAFRCC